MRYVELKVRQKMMRQIRLAVFPVKDLNALCEPAQILAEEKPQGTAGDYEFVFVSTMSKGGGSLKLGRRQRRLQQCADSFVDRYKADVELVGPKDRQFRYILPAGRRWSTDIVKRPVT